MQHVPEQFVGFVLRRHTVVARDGDLDIRRNDVALERVHFLQDLSATEMAFAPGRLAMESVTAGSSAEIPIRRAGAKEHILARFFRAVHDVRHVAQINRLAGINAHHHVAHVLGGLQKRAGFHDDFMVVAGQVAGGILPVRLLQHRHQAGGRKIARRQPHRVEQHAHLPLRAADDGRLGDQRHLLHRVIHLRGQPPQREMIVMRTVNRQRQNRHVVNRPRLDERRGNAVRNLVEIRLQLLVQLHQAAFHVFADLEPHDDQSTGLRWKWSRCIPRREFPRAAFPSGAWRAPRLPSRRKPGMETSTSTIGTLICGSSSRGSITTANTPSSSDAMTMSSVSLESMNDCAMRPAMPRCAPAELSLAGFHGLIVTGCPSSKPTRLRSRLVRRNPSRKPLRLHRRRDFRF